MAAQFLALTYFCTPADFMPAVIAVDVHGRP